MFGPPCAANICPDFSAATTFSWVSLVFKHAAEAITRFGKYKHGLTIEVIAGEGFSVLDKIRFGGMKHRAEKFPVPYDRIHLSNVPDYA